MNANSRRPQTIELRITENNYTMKTLKAISSPKPQWITQKYRTLRPSLFFFWGGGGEGKEGWGYSNLETDFIFSSDLLQYTGSLSYQQSTSLLQ